MVALCFVAAALCHGVVGQDHCVCHAPGAAPIVLVEAKPDSMERRCAARAAVFRDRGGDETWSELVGEAPCGGRIRVELAGTRVDRRTGPLVLCGQASLAGGCIVRLSALG